MRRLLLSAVLVPVLVTVAPAQGVVGRNDDVFTWAERVANGSWFRFHSPNGRVTVTQSTGNQVEVRAEKVRGATDAIGFVVARDGSNITVCAVYSDDDRCNENGLRTNRRSWSNGRSSPRVDVTIGLPAGVRVRVGTGNGDVSVTGAGSDAVVASGNGEVEVNGVGGELRISSGNGRVTVNDARGPVRASTGNGDVRVGTTVGPVTASSGNGDLFVTMGALRSAENMEYTTGNGRIVVTLPADFAGEIDASTGNGSITTDFPIQLQGRISKTRLRGTIGQGGRRLRLISGNGDIELRRP